MAATKARPATDEPVKRTATKTPAKKASAAKSANGSAPAKRAAKSTAASRESSTATKPAKATAAKAAKAATAAKSHPSSRGAKATDDASATRGRAKKATSPEPGVVDEDLTDEIEGDDDLEAEPGDDLEVEEADLELEDLEVDEEAGAEEAADGASSDDDDAEPAAESGEEAAAATAEDDEIAEPTEKDKASGDFVWDEEESEALRQARKDAELTASADSVRAYLKQIGKVALLNAEEEVELAKRIEAGLYATQLMAEKADRGEKYSPKDRRDMAWICRDGDRAKNHLLEANLRLVVSLAKRYTGRGMAFLDEVEERHAAAGVALGQ